MTKLTDNSEYRFRGNSFPILIDFSSQVDGLVFRKSDSIHIGDGDFSLRYQIHSGSVTHAVLYPPGNIPQAAKRVLRGPKHSFSLVKWSCTSPRRPRCVELFLRLSIVQATVHYALIHSYALRMKLIVKSSSRWQQTAVRHISPSHELTINYYNFFTRSRRCCHLQIQNSCGCCNDSYQISTLYVSNFRCFYF